MSKMTNYMENKLADFVRGQGLTLPTNWYFALGSAGDDTGITELSGSGYARVSKARSLTNFAGTQSAGSTLASTGTSHVTSNNNTIDWGTAGAAWGTWTHIGVFDASTSGNCWIWTEVPSTVIGNGDPVSVASGQFSVELGLLTMSDYLANALIDLIFRAQAYSWPANTYLAYYTAAPTNAGGGTECSGGAYARAAIASSLAAWSGTQSAGSTVASSGTGGRISNNGAVTPPTPPTVSWGTIVAAALRDASTSGNLLFWKTVTPRTVVVGAAPAFAANTLGLTFA